jgi:hypothetical protein
MSAMGIFRQLGAVRESGKMPVAHLLVDSSSEFYSGRCCSPCQFKLETKIPHPKDFATRNQSKFLDRIPFSNLIFKPWYPTYLRIMGVWIWMFALVFGYAFLTPIHQ